MKSWAAPVGASQGLTFSALLLVSFARAILTVFGLPLVFAATTAQLWSPVSGSVGSNGVQPVALRAAVPLLCTETALSPRTRVRGTGVIADSGGALITAAHIILDAHSDCTLSVLVPDDEWSRIGRLHAFLVGDCRLNRSLDLAVCRIRPTENLRDWGFLTPARFSRRAFSTGETVSVTAFTGWGLIPLTRSGHVRGRENYLRPDGCYCNFALDIAAAEGMSGSPVVSSEGEVLGILTLAGSGKFRGMSFGASLEDASEFLNAQGLNLKPR